MRMVLKYIVLTACAKVTARKWASMCVNEKSAYWYYWLVKKKFAHRLQRFRILNIANQTEVIDDQGQTPSEQILYTEAEARSVRVCEIRAWTVKCPDGICMVNEYNGDQWFHEKTGDSSSKMIDGHSTGEEWNWVAGYESGMLILVMPVHTAQSGGWNITCKLLQWNRLIS